MLMEAAQAGPSWMLIASAACTLLCALIASFATGLRSRVDKVETETKELRKDQTTLEKMILRDYHDKREISDLLAQLRDSMTAIHRRLDLARFPSFPPENDHG